MEFVIVVVVVFSLFENVDISLFFKCCIEVVSEVFVDFVDLIVCFVIRVSFCSLFMFFGFWGIIICFRFGFNFWIMILISKCMGRLYLVVNFVMWVM